MENKKTKAARILKASLDLFSMLALVFMIGYVMYESFFFHKQPDNMTIFTMILLVANTKKDSLLSNS